MIIPPRLREGDIVAIAAPARKVSPAQLDPAIILLTSWGLTPRLPPNIFSTNHSYLAGTDQERLEDFQGLINDPEVKAIFCARGGYGSTRIIDDIDFTPLIKNPKWIVGFSDITAFHLRLLSIGMTSIHGTMPIFFGHEDAQSSVETIYKVLFEGACHIEFPSVAHNRRGQGHGMVVGGNLSLIVDALNTPSEPNTEGKILVIEEVDEYFYKLDRMLTQLRRSGKLEKLAGLLIGHMTDIKNPELPFGETAHEIVLHAVRDYRYPVAFSLPSGHKNPNLAWLQGGTAMLKVDDDKTRFSYPNIFRPQ